MHQKIFGVIGFARRARDPRTIVEVSVLIRYVFGCEKARCYEGFGKGKGVDEGEEEKKKEGNERRGGLFCKQRSAIPLFALPH